MFPKLLSANTLYQRLQQPGDLLILDVRNSEAFQRARIETRHTPETLNIPYFEFIEDDTVEEALACVPAGRPIVVVCVHGGTSELVAAMLRKRGYQAANLAGGMEEWSRLHMVRPVLESDSAAIYQIERVARGCLSYAIISDGWGAIIDPSHHIAEYRRLLAAHGAAPRLIIDTHAHADHISGGPALAEATGVPYYLHPYDAIHPLDVMPAVIPYETLRNGHRFRLGSVTVRAVHAPGHTLGHVALLASTLEGECYLFSGDSLFLRGVGRPDLGGRAESWTRLSYESIFTTLRAMTPLDALVLPGHYSDAGEADARGVFAAPFAELWRTNTELSFATQEALAHHVLANLPAAPPEYAEIKRVNMGLAQADAQRALALEMGRNACALLSDYPASVSLVPG